MDTVDTALSQGPAAPGANVKPIVSEVVTLKADNCPVTLPQDDAEALVAAGLAVTPPPPVTVVLLADAGGHRAGTVARVSPAMVAQLGAKARPATTAEAEIGGPNLKILTSL